MKFISHRGNLTGSNSNLENHPDTIRKCLNLGFDVEIDVWAIDKKFFLGHDQPQHEVDLKFLRQKGLWCHAKNQHALQAMMLENDIHCFWHQEDDYTITSKGVVWCFPGKLLPVNSVCVMPEKASYSRKEISQCIGICSDYIELYEEFIEKKELSLSSKNT